MDIGASWSGLTRAVLVCRPSCAGGGEDVADVVRYRVGSGVSAPPASKYSLTTYSRSGDPSLAASRVVRSAQSVLRPPPTYSAHTTHIDPYGAVRGRMAPARRYPTYPNSAIAAGMTAFGASLPTPRCETEQTNQTGSTLPPRTTTTREKANVARILRARSGLLPVAPPASGPLRKVGA